MKGLVQEFKELFWIVKAYRRATKRQLATDGPTEVDLLTEIREQLRARD